MLQTEHWPLLQVIADFFSDLLSGAMETPSNWRLSKLKVIFKKGRPDLPQNYRPILILPVMAKLFSTVLYLRIRGQIDESLSEEQFGFHVGRGCRDAVHVLRTVIEKSLKWGEELWLSALDVEKAFDRIHHADLFHVLLYCRVDASVVAALLKLYTGAQAFLDVVKNVHSRSFDVQMGGETARPPIAAAFQSCF
jgi:Reverse transcriptase (RNA-dependent DNA polymerase).